MTADVARNQAAIRNLAHRLETLGYTGDTHAEAEHIAHQLHTDGWRPLDPPPAPAGPGASRQAIEAALQAAADAVRAAREKRTTATKESA